MTSLKKSRDLGYHFDLFWKYGSTYGGWVTDQVWSDLDKYFSRKLRRGGGGGGGGAGKITSLPGSDTADPNSELEIGYYVGISCKRILKVFFD